LLGAAELIGRSVQAWSRFDLFLVFWPMVDWSETAEFSRLASQQGDG
jgi:hypothetical protein